MVGARGFEPPTSRSRTVRSTRLSHAPKTELPKHYAGARRECQTCAPPASSRARNLFSRRAFTYSITGGSSESATTTTTTFSM
jgi:hypothetical protein